MADQIEEMQRQGGTHDYFRSAGGGARTSASDGYTFEDLDLGGSDLNDILGGLFGGRGRGRQQAQPRARKGDDLEHPVEITLEEAYAGTTRMVALQTPETCTTCDGTGKLAGQACPICDGLGSLIKTKRLEVK